MLEFLSSLFLAFHVHLIELPKPLVVPHSDRLIIWNIGQGQWVSLSTDDSCFHFDMGGEHADWAKISAECGTKNNFAFLSHWDIDHLSFLHLASRYLKNFCIAAMPRGPSPSEKKSKIFMGLRHCSGPAFIREIFSLPDSVTRFSSNDYSRVFEIGEWALSQGDSPKKQEKIWSSSVNAPLDVRVLVLGHHGSRTSTSEKLLSALPGLKMAISSARISRYGHPHREVLDRLKNFGVACLRTEYWGNIHIDVPDKEKAQMNAPFLKN